MHILVFEVTEEKKRECEEKFLKDKFFAIGNNDGLYNLTFMDASIHTATGDGLVIHDNEVLTYFDKADFSFIKIL